LIPKLRNSAITASFLDAVNISGVAIMIVVTFQLRHSDLIDWKAWLIAILSAIIYFGWNKINVLWLIFGSALLGYLLSLI